MRGGNSDEEGEEAHSIIVDDFEPPMVYSVVADRSVVRSVIPAEKGSVRHNKGGVSGAKNPSSTSSFIDCSRWSLCSPDPDLVAKEEAREVRKLVRKINLGEKKEKEAQTTMESRHSRDARVDPPEENSSADEDCVVGSRGLCGFSMDQGTDSSPEVTNVNSGSTEEFTVSGTYGTSLDDQLMEQDLGPVPYARREGLPELAASSFQRLREVDDLVVGTTEKAPHRASTTAKPALYRSSTMPDPEKTSALISPDTSKKINRTLSGSLAMHGVTSLGHYNSPRSGTADLVIHGGIVPVADRPAVAKAPVHRGVSYRAFVTPPTITNVGGNSSAQSVSAFFPDVMTEKRQTSNSSVNSKTPLLFDAKEAHHAPASHSFGDLPLTYSPPDDLIKKEGSKLSVGDILELKVPKIKALAETARDIAKVKKRSGVDGTARSRAVEGEGGSNSKPFWHHISRFWDFSSKDEKENDKIQPHGPNASIVNADLTGLDPAVAAQVVQPEMMQAGLELKEKIQKTTDATTKSNELLANMVLENMKDMLSAMWIEQHERMIEEIRAEFDRDRTKVDRFLSCAYVVFSKFVFDEKKSKKKKLPGKSSQEFEARVNAEFQKLQNKLADMNIAIKKTNEGIQVLDTKIDNAISKLDDVHGDVIKNQGLIGENGEALGVLSEKIGFMEKVVALLGGSTLTSVLVIIGMVVFL